jgi:hypothetical protein
MSEYGQANLARLCRAILNPEKIGDPNFPRVEATCAYCGATFETYEGMPTRLSDVAHAQFSSKTSFPIDTCKHPECAKKELRRQDVMFNLIHQREIVSKQLAEKQAAEPKPEQGEAKPLPLPPTLEVEDPLALF